MKVYNKTLFADLINGSSPPRQTNGIKKRKKKLTDKDKELIRAQLRHEKWVEMQLVKQKEADYVFQEKLQLRRRREEKEFEEEMDRLSEGDRFVDSIDRFLTMQDQAAQQKCEKLYLDWNDQVFQKIQDRTAKSLASIDSKTLKRLKTKQFNDFLKLANSSAGGMFLDSKPPVGMTSQKPIQFPKVNVQGLKDPSRRILQKHAEENLSVSNIGSKARIRKPRRRHVLDPTQWAAGKVEATPHGHFAEMMGSPPRRSDDKPSVNKSRINFDHYNIEKTLPKRNVKHHNAHQSLWSEAWKNDPFAKDGVTAKIGSPPHRQYRQNNGRSMMQDALS